MFFTKAIISAVVVAAVSLGANAHAGVTPALNVRGGKISRAAVTRPNNGNPCPNVNIAQALNGATVARAGADGSFSVTATNFNGGRDGSRQFTARVDASGTGRQFVNAQVTKNGQVAPAGTGSEQLTVKLPAGTKCAGGAGKNTCVVSFVSAGGFGNCVAVQQGAGRRDEVDEDDEDLVEIPHAEDEPLFERADEDDEEQDDEEELVEVPHAEDEPLFERDEEFVEIPHAADEPLFERDEELVEIPHAADEPLFEREAKETRAANNTRGKRMSFGKRRLAADH